MTVFRSTRFLPGFEGEVLDTRSRQISMFISRGTPVRDTPVVSKNRLEFVSKRIARDARSLPPGISRVPASGASSGEQDTSLSETYSATMSSAMGAVLTYDHSRGMNYTRILDDLIVGSCLQTPHDVETLEGEGVTTVLQLQEDSDLAYFSLDNSPIRARCASGKQIEHIRHAVRDFDPYSLRRRLPEAVALIAQRVAKLGPANGTTYIHCTAGLGRAPATALAYMWWFKDMPLDAAMAHLTGLRPCKPREEAIREAAVDLLYGKDPIDVTIALRRRDAGASDVRIAGIDVGWGQSVPLVPAPTGQPKQIVKRQLPPGKYQFKFIWDGVWGISMDHMTTIDGDNVNNMLVVPDAELGAEAAHARHRIRTGGDLTDQERARVRDILMRMNTNPYTTSAPANLQPL